MASNSSNSSSYDVSALEKELAALQDKLEARQKQSRSLKRPSPAANQSANGTPQSSTPMGSYGPRNSTRKAVSEQKPRRTGDSALNGVGNGSRSSTAETRRYQASKASKHSPKSADVSPFLAQEEEASRQRRTEKEKLFEQEFSSLQSRVSRRADEKLMWERTRQRLQLQLEESRDEGAALRRKLRAAETELMETKSLLNQCRQEGSGRDEELHTLQRKLPQLMRRAEESSSQVETLKRERDEARSERDAIRAEAAATRQQDASVKSEMEQSNVRLLNEIFALNTRLTEAMLQASELRSEISRREEMARKETHAKENSESVVRQLNEEVARLKRELERSHEKDVYLTSTASAVNDEKERLERELRRQKEATMQCEDGRSEERKEYDRRLNELQDQLEAERSLRMQLEEVNEGFENQFLALKEKIKSKISTTKSPDGSPVAASNTRDLETTPDSRRPAKSSYKPYRDDEIDELVASEMLRSDLASGLEFLPPNFARITRGTYRFGTRKISIHVQGGRPVVRVGGGFMAFIPFVQKYGKLECMKIAKSSVSPNTTPNTKKTRAGKNTVKRS